MKASTSRLIIAAAALAAAADSVYAQSLKAEIPFTFHTSNATLAPGAYVISVNYSAGRQYLILRNADTGNAVMLSQYVDAVASKAMEWDNTAKLTFECTKRACVLRELWKGGGSGGFQFLGPRLPRNADTHIAIVGLTTLKAD
jgi:hypothetical protein